MKNLMSGPVEIVYMVNKEKNKKIIIMGDIHDGVAGTCDNKNAIDLIDYMDKIKTNCDLFIEHSFRAYENINEKTDLIHYMGRMDVYGKNNYKKKDNMRIHFTDVRQNTYHMAYLTSMYFHNMKNILNILAKSSNGIDIMNAFMDVNISYYDMLWDNYVYLVNGNLKEWVNDGYKKEYIENNISKMFVKQMNKLDKDIKQKLVNIFLLYLINWNDYLWNDKKTEYRDWSSDPSTIYLIHNIGAEAGMLFADLYTIARIMKDDKYNNNILYVGAGHIPGIIKMLKAIDFNIIYHNESDKKNMRCIEFIDFDEFFNE